MGIETEDSRRPGARGALPQVHCAACGSKFESERAATGALVRCPLCGETVEVAELVASKRRYRSRTPRPLEEGRRIPRTTYRRGMRVVVVVAVITGAAAALLSAWAVDRERRAGPAVPPVGPFVSPR